MDTSPSTPLDTVSPSPAPKDPFKDERNRFRMKSLFEEYPGYGYPPIYTLKRFNTSVPSLYLLFMETRDITEYEFALKAFNSWDHWLALQSTSWFAAHLTSWRNELVLRIKHDLYKSMERIASDKSEETGHRLQAIKWMHQHLVEKNSKPGRGRPSKEEVENALREELQVSQEHQNDLERITKVN